MKLNARVLNIGHVTADAFVVDQAFSFIGDFDPYTGTLLLPEHTFSGQSLAGKVLVCPNGKGGTMAPFLLYEAHQRGNAPAAILCDHADQILFESAMAINIPILDCFDRDVCSLFLHGQSITIAGNDVTV
ncbi:TPA: DUF126 domain-containing protein [Vibrio parahaemolyticus]